VALMTMIQRGLPTPELRDEHRAGVPNAFRRVRCGRCARIARQASNSSSRFAR
jgi:hypothetical protein